LVIVNSEILSLAFENHGPQASKKENTIRQHKGLQEIEKTYISIIFRKGRIC